MTQPTATRAAIAAMGRDLGPEVLARCSALFTEEQAALARALPVAAADVAYGPDARHRLDLYGSPGGGAPVVAFFHGGGFRLGDKGGGDRWANASVGRMAARAGLLGVVANYRLAPAHGWPAGAEDVAGVVDWLRANAAAHGGDPARIVLVGTSAGAVHVAAYLKLLGDVAPPVRGAVLLSGLYGHTPLDERDTLYYGDPALYPERMPREAIAATPLPLLVACAEFDPPRFQAEFAGLLGNRLARHGTLPRAAVVAGHNHYSLAMHLGTSDTRLAGMIVDFVGDATASAGDRP